MCRTLQCWYIVCIISCTVCPEKVSLTISENIPKPRNKLWMLCSDAWENLHKTHMCLGQGLGVSVQLKKFQNLFRGFVVLDNIPTQKDISDSNDGFWWLGCVNFLHPRGPAPSFYYPVNQDIFHAFDVVDISHPCIDGNNGVPTCTSFQTNIALEGVFQKRKGLQWTMSELRVMYWRFVTCPCMVCIYTFVVEFRVLRCFVFIINYYSSVHILSDIEKKHLVT